MDKSKNLSDDTVLAELGDRLARQRLTRRLTQADLAREAGVSKRTVERLEAGASVQLENLIRVLRALDLLPQLEQLIPVVGPSPLDAVKLKGRERQRASASMPEPADGPWSWNEEDDTP